MTNPFSYVAKVLRSEKSIKQFKETLKMKNWKTSLLGGISLVIGLASIWAPPAYQQKVQATAGVLAGLGLIAAKDGNVTGGTVAATPEAKARIEKP